MQRTISATEARIQFGELMRRVVEQQELVIVEHSGKSHVVVLSVDKYQRLLAAQEEREDWREARTSGAGAGTGRPGRPTASWFRLWGTICRGCTGWRDEQIAA